MNPPRDPDLFLQAFGAFGLLVLLVAVVIALVRRRPAPAVEPVEVAPARAPEDELCPCGAEATDPIPVVWSVYIPIFRVRLVFRLPNIFGKRRVCAPHAAVAGSVLDERIALAKLADARAQRDKVTAIANAEDVLFSVVSDLPPAQKKAWERQRALSGNGAVRVLRAVNDAPPREDEKTGTGGG